MHRWGNKKDMAGDDPPYLSVGTEVSAKYKGAFCEAKIRKVVKAVKCKVQYKNEAGSAFVSDEQIKGVLMPGASVEVKQPDKKEHIEGTIIKIQDLSQYTVVFDDGDIATLRRTALCLKSGRHFAEGETLDQLPLTHPEHFSTPVVSGMRGSRRRDELEENSDDESKRERKIEREEDMGKVVCVEMGDKKKSKDNWFPGLIVAPNAQDSVKIDVEDEYLVRSFKDGRYYTVPKRETVEFTREVGAKVDNPTLKMAVEKAISFLDKDDLPPHWDREVLFSIIDFTSESDGSDTDSTDDEPCEEKDHFVAQLYKFMDDRGTPINKEPMISSKDVDLYKLYKIVNKLGGYNRVTNRNQWKSIAIKLGYTANQTNNVKTSYKKYLHNFEDFYRKLGCTMLSHNTTKLRSRSTRPLIRDRDKSLIEKPEKEDSNSNDGDESLEGGKELQNGVKTKLEIQIKDDVDVIDDKQKIEFKKENQKLKRELSVEIVKDDEKPKKTTVKVENSNVVATVIKDTTQPTASLVTTKETKVKTVKSDAPKEEKASGGEKKSERKALKATSKLEPNDSVKKIDKPKTKTAKLKGVEKRIKKNDNVLPGIRTKRSLKERMKAIVKRLKLKNGANSSNEQDKKKQKNVDEANKASPQLYKLKRKEEILNNGTKTRKLSVGNNEARNITGVGSASDRKSTSSSTSGGNTSDGGNSASSSSKVRKHDDDNGEGPKKKTYTRKKKDEDKYSSNSSDSLINQSIDIVSPHKTICIGDKLKVYYGPSHEPQVTYEAKVMNKRYGAVTEYLVHYTGWNTRYDEWIRRSRIAEDLSWTPARDKLKYNQIEPPQLISQLPPQVDQQSQQNQNVAKPFAEKVKRSSISPVGKNRSKSIPKTGGKPGRNAKSKSPTKFDVAKGKKPSSSKADSGSSDESESESNQKQELQKTRSRTERQKQQDEDTSSKDSDSKSKKPSPLKRTRSGSLKLESKEEPAKKRKVTKTTNKASRATAIRNSIMKNLVPRKRLVEKGKKLFKKRDRSSDKERDDDDAIKDTDKLDEHADAMETNDSPDTNDEDNDSKADSLEEIEKKYCENTELVLKIKPFPSPGAIVDETDPTIEQMVKLEPVETKDKGINVSVDSDDAGPPVLKKEILSDDDAGTAPNTTSQFLADSYLAENLDKPKAAKTKTKKDTDEKSGSLATPKLLARSTAAGADKSPAKTSGDLKEKTFFTSRTEKSETKKTDTVDKDKKDVKLRSVTTFNSYLNMDKIDSIRKSLADKTPSTDKCVEKTSSPGKLGDADGAKCEDDIYEFKEPEPFEFRGIDDRTILHRRPPSRIFEEASFKRVNKATASPSDTPKDDESCKTIDESDPKTGTEETTDREDEESSKEKEASSKTTEISKPEKTDIAAKREDDESSNTDVGESIESDIVSKIEPVKEGEDAKTTCAQISGDLGNKELYKIDDVVKSSLYSLENEDKEDDEDMDDVKLIISETEQLDDTITLAESITNKIIGGKIDEVSVVFDEDDKAPKLDPVTVEPSETPAEETKKSKPSVVEPATTKSSSVASSSKKDEEKLTAVSSAGEKSIDDEIDKLRANETLDSDDESVYSTKSSTSSGNKDLTKASGESDSIDDDKDDEYLSSDSTSAISHEHLSVKKQEHPVKTYSSDTAQSAKRKAALELKNDSAPVKIEETSSAIDATVDKMDTDDTLLPHHDIINEVEIEIFTAIKKDNIDQTESKNAIKDDEKDATIMEIETIPDTEETGKTKDEDDNDGLLLCEETIPKSPETKDTAHINDDEVSYPGGSGINNDAKKLPDKSAKTKKSPRSSNFSAPATVFENTPPTTPEDSSPGNSPSDERSGFSSTTFSLNEKCTLNKDSSENDTYSDNSEKSLRTKKYHDENGAYKKKNSYDYDSYAKRKSEKDAFYKNDEPAKKKPKPYGSVSANESEKDDYSDEGNSPKSTTSSQKFSKSSYYLELDPNLDPNQRIEILEQKLQDLRKQYLSLKQELVSIDKKRKKLRRKEREGRMMTRNEANSLL